MYNQPNPTRNYVYQYNLNIERQLTPTLSLLIGYSGSRGLHNPFQADTVNTVIPKLDPTTHAYYWPVSYDVNQSTTPTPVAAGGYVGDPNNPCPAISYTNPAPGAISTNCYLENTSTTNGIYNTLWQSRSWYNALQIKLDKRMSHGFQVQVAYTYSKSIDDSSGSTAGDTFSADIVSEPWYNLSLDKGLSDFDVRNNIVINGLWNIPSVPKFAGTPEDKILGGWQVGIITTLGSGVPVSASMTAFNNAFDLAGELITTNQPPNLVAGCSPQNLVNSSYRTSLIYIKPGCLGIVPETTANAAICDTTRYAGLCPNIRGDLGRDTIIGPGLFDMDFSVLRTITFARSRRHSTCNSALKCSTCSIMRISRQRPTSTRLPVST
jgi:hypothetical protein